MFIIPNDILTFLNKLPLSKGPIVVGVSGGADSLYLTYLLAEWAKRTKRTLLSVTIDHGLRPEALEEANWVHKKLTAQKIDHTILTWEGIKPKTHIEERAREKRYQLLLDFCHQHNASALFLAHHQQDQAETFWTRLAHSSGLDGLCAISSVTQREGILLVRPLLKMPKNEIVATLKRHKYKWVEDPMNKNDAYERVQWRQKQKELDKMGLNAKVIEKATNRLQRAKNALNFYTIQFLQDHLEKTLYGFVKMDEKIFNAQPIEIRIRVLMHILKALTNQNKIISLESIEKLVETMPKYATLAGTQWVISHHQIFLAPELKHVEKKLIPERQWTDWGICQVWANKSFYAEAKAPSPRIKNVPYLIQRTILKIPEGYKHLIYTEKELAKKLKLDYKSKTPVIIFKLKEQKEKA